MSAVDGSRELPSRARVSTRFPVSGRILVDAAQRRSLMRLLLREDVRYASAAAACKLLFALASGHQSLEIAHADDRRVAVLQPKKFRVASFRDRASESATAALFR